MSHDANLNVGALRQTWNDEGIIDRLLTVDAAPLPAERTTLKLFDRSRGEEQNVAGVSAEFRKRTMSVLRIAFLSSAVLEFFSCIAMALVAVYLGTTYLGYSNFGLYGQTLTLKHGLFILLLAPDFYLPLRELGIHYHARAEALGAAESILEILTASPATTFTGKQRIDAEVKVDELTGKIIELIQDHEYTPILLSFPGISHVAAATLISTIGTIIAGPRG